MNYILTEGDLRQRQSLSLDAKIRFSMRVISSFIDEYGTDGVYISFSGGLDSTVMRDLVHKVDSSIISVYADTWMEDPRIRDYVKGTDNLEVLRPSMLLKDIISEHGWCFPSKDVSQAVYYARQGKTWALNKLQGFTNDGKSKSAFRQQYRKFLPVIDWDIKISPFCCDEQKEKPFMQYERETGRHPFIGTRADESQRRKYSYLRTGCNTFDVSYRVNEETGETEEVKNDRPCSRPIAIFTRQDILAYIVREDLYVPDPYGKIYSIGQCVGQYNFWSDKPCGKLDCTGDKRTGCIFCPVACHLDNFAKFKNVKNYNKKLYEYCMDELGERRLLEKVKKQFGGDF